MFNVACLKFACTGIAQCNVCSVQNSHSMTKPTKTTLGTI